MFVSLVYESSIPQKAVCHVTEPHLPRISPTPQKSLHYGAHHTLQPLLVCGNPEQEDQVPKAAYLADPQL